ncbi:cytoplasmic tRNA 2-thiolation protein 2 isoform X2 [Ischnura elegans]|uniref:cytoplasmic tRNA 2-thiolation protein 2 isoform X2 n=1 Tax=Ischnura elegans TaxID=197161 RepID=UPI001ED8BFEC|nr:cytoplasmic tRNA 2-thiolation protein 2 isoform X2 [Ischnura elegans]
MQTSRFLVHIYVIDNNVHAVSSALSRYPPIETKVNEFTTNKLVASVTSKIRNYGFINQKRKNALCKRCSLETACVVLRTKDPYCRSCFLKYATHKFRATLGKSKLVRPNDRVLICSSGSQSSVALLRFVADGLSEQANKRFLFTPMVVYVDEGAIAGVSREERLEAIKAAAVQAGHLSFPFYSVQLSNSLNLGTVRMDKVDSKGEGIDLSERELVAGDEQLLALFSGVTTLTAKEDLLGKIRHNLLVAVAKELHCNKMFLADNGSHLAVALISGVAAGRGACLPSDCGFCDARDSAVMVLRPLKEFMSKEIAFFCVLNKLVPVTVPSLCTKASRMASIRRLTEDFLHGLQADFPSTFSSVIKTGDKLAPPMPAQQRCTLCKILQRYMNGMYHLLVILERRENMEHEMGVWS